MDYNEIGQRIRQYRKERAFSQEQLAEAVGISVTHMSHIETGGTKLSLQVLVDISKALEVSADSILFDKKVNKTADLLEIMQQCNAMQLDIIAAIIKAAKSSLDKYI